MIQTESSDGEAKMEDKKAEAIMQRREQAAATVGRTTNADFLGFRSSFLDQIAKLKKGLLSVYTDDKMAIDELYNITNEVFSGLQYKMDAVIYLNAIYSSENFVIEHCLRVGLLANILSHWLNYDELGTKDATIAGFLHDIGMLQVPTAIIEKHGTLTPEEFATLREHTVRGALMLINKGVKESIKEVVRSHHERFDGSGYPRGLKGGNIHTLAALISIVDVYDSMTSNRPYRVASCPFDVIDFFEKQMLDKFNPGLLYTFLENIPYMYSGSLVRLTDGSSGRVVFINKNHKTSPIVQIAKTDEVVDLYARKDLKITSLL